MKKIFPSCIDPCIHCPRGSLDNKFANLLVNALHVDVVACNLCRVVRIVHVGGYIKYLQIHIKIVIYTSFRVTAQTTLIKLADAPY